MLTEKDKQEMEIFCCTWGVSGVTAKPMIRKLLDEIKRLNEEIAKTNDGRRALELFGDNG